ncbi:MAG: hypothetical protein IJU70_06480 [Lentisphaeria bacterium]|nr:hypothetical protein [Lentisphaeria bacterium]
MKDKYGRKENSLYFRQGELEPYIVEERSGVTYICYTDEPQRAIRRITETTSEGVTTTVIEIAYGAWADRTTLTYRPVNSELP